MEFVEVNKPNALGGRLINIGGEDKVVVAIKENGNTVIEILDAASEFIGDFIPKATFVAQQIMAFFDDIFNTLPTFIENDGFRYRLTLQPAKGKSPDIVMYLNEIASDVFLKVSAPTLFKAKGKMHDALEEKQLLL